MNPRFLVQAAAGALSNLGIFGLLLFLPAGTLDWWRAWVFLGIVTAASVATLLLVFRNNEELLRERMKPLIQKGQPLSDRLIVIPLVLSFLGIIALIPVDVFHLHLLPRPDPAVALFGLFLFLAGWVIISVVFHQNRFTAPVVKRLNQQRVVDTGLYGLVRHPMYAGSILFFVGIPLWLESWAAVIFTIVPCGLLAVRCVFEERFLARELPGYADYVKKVRFRLIPGVW